jgi:hypothetical protein
MNERRNRRSDKAHEAMTLFLESLREKVGLAAVALTTTDGLLLAGAGPGIDLEWMGAIGAASPRATFSWDDHTLHVQPIDVNRTELRLTCSGSPVHTPSVAAGLARILAA